MRIAAGTCGRRAVLRFVLPARFLLRRTGRDPYVIA